jgi:hypothetical protein
MQAIDAEGREADWQTGIRFAGLYMKSMRQEDAP